MEQNQLNNQKPSDRAGKPELATAPGSENLFSAYFHLMWGVAAGEIDPSYAAKKATLLAEEYAKATSPNTTVLTRSDGGAES